MKLIKKTKNKMDNITKYLHSQDITVYHVNPQPSICDFDTRLRRSWSPFMRQLKNKVELNDHQEAMSLASMSAVHYLEAESGMKIFDACAAPGMKGLYLNKLVPDIGYYANDLSADRIVRMKRLFNKHDIQPKNLTKIDARYIDRTYDPEFFDRILIDAPCSGEGVALAGDNRLVKAWSPAKVKRLQQLQVRIVKSAYKLLKPGGRLVYATCTLNKNENERVIKKALGCELVVQTSELSISSLPKLNDNDAWRILPSKNSIGFFIAVVIKKPNVYEIK